MCTTQVICIMPLFGVFMGFMGCEKKEEEGWSDIQELVKKEGFVLKVPKPASELCPRDIGIVRAGDGRPAVLLG